MQTKGLNLILPELDKEYSLKNDNELFEHICKKELEEKLKNISKEKHEFYQDRLNYEIEIFKNYNLTGYMLIARDFIKYTRKTNILYVSRGSLVCSLAAYILNITQFDPIKYDLVFERFLNPKDIRLPNISFDFDPEAKDKIFKYLVKKFGKDSIVNQIGIIKFLTFEFLSLKELTLIQKTKQLIKQDIDLDNLDLNDKKVYELISSGNTKGIFQIESKSMQNAIKKLKPTCFDDIVSILALYRPGPIEVGMLDDFIDRKHSKEPIDHYFNEIKEQIEPILRSTYGVIVFQEQLDLILQILMDITLSEAEILRKAMGRKEEKLLQKYKKDLQSKIGRENASKLFDELTFYSGFLFNKSHVLSYSLIVYKMAYLKTYYFEEFSEVLDKDEFFKRLKVYPLQEVKQIVVNE